MVFNFYILFISLLFKLKTNISLIKSIIRSLKLHNIRFIFPFNVFSKRISFCFEIIYCINLKTINFLIFNEFCHNFKYYLWIYFIWKLTCSKFDKKLAKRISEYFIYYICYVNVSVITNIMFRNYWLLWLNMFLHFCMLHWIIPSIL